MKMRLILSILTLVKCCTHSSAETISSVQGIDKRIHRKLPHHGNEMGGSPKFDIRGWKKTSKKESAPSHDDLSIAPAESPFTAESPGYYHGGKGYGKSTKGSKKSSKKSKKSKRGKVQKKNISKKLKKSDESYDEDYVYEYTELPSASPQSKEGISAPPSSVPAADGSAITLSPTSGSLLGRVSSRTRGFDNVAQDNSFRSPNGQRTAPNANEGIPFGFPMIQRELYPGPVSLKAHSSINLGEMETEIFEILQFEISGYLREMAGTLLKKYNLEVIYSPGPDTSHLGVIVTSIDIACTLMVESASKDDLVSVSHETAKGWIRDFFGGPSLFSLLGELRQNGIDVNEIVFLEEEFQSGLFTGNTIASSVTTSGTQNAKNISPEDSDENKNRVGLFAGIFIGIFALSTVLFVHFRGRYSREFLGSIRSAFSSDSDSSESTSKKEAVSARQRSWSGSFRRHPAGGVRPAAIQKNPALSKSFLRERSDKGLSPSEEPKQALSFLEDQSFSIAEGDYNIPAEYDFKKSPNPSMQSPKLPNHSRDQDDEFSMPGDYHTVTEECSIMKGDGKSPPGSQQSPNSSSAGGPRRVNPFVYGSPWNGSPAQTHRPGGQHSQLASPATGSSIRCNSLSIPLQMTSPESSRFIDEWSIDSYDTKTPASQHCRKSVPYRDWHDPPSPSQTSQLDMPHLS